MSYRHSNTDIIMLNKTLAEYQTDVYRLHDKEDFEGLSDIRGYAYSHLISRLE